jgi:hypothetical protein
MISIRRVKFFGLKESLIRSAHPVKSVSESFLFPGERANYPTIKSTVAEGDDQILYAIKLIGFLA